MHFDDHLELPTEMCGSIKGMERKQVETSAAWDRRAKARRRAIDRCMWNESEGLYFDYDTVKKEQTGYESATTFWAMWAGLASPPQAAALVTRALPKFEALGGLVSGTEVSRVCSVSSTFFPIHTTSRASDILGAKACSISQASLITNDFT